VSTREVSPRPPLQFPKLPILEALPALGTALAARGRAVLQAPPGAGKSTIVPLALLAAPWLGGRKILMLEPRRLAARAVAARMAHLLGEAVGRTVGHRMRLDTRVGRDTRIEVVTEGVLTRMMQEDAALTGVGCVIFDEFHERSLHADLGLALCIESQQMLREDLRLLVMSATLDPAPLARLLDDAPTISTGGRLFEVTTHYVARRPELRLEQQATQVLRTALRDNDGDILCFLPGSGEIRQVGRTLAAARLGDSVRVHELYGDLAAPLQDAALAPAAAGVRKIVLATSIAETSLTIEGVRVVVDTGLRRYTEFDPATGMSRLVTGKVSQAAADQRRGRAGRLSEGVCYRLWSEGAQAALAPQSPAEIVHADLAPLALELAAWGTRDALDLRWLDPPPAAALAQARDLLRRLEALDAADRITAHGRRLARIGAHPRLAHMLERSEILGARRLACDLAAILSERDVLRAVPGARDADLRLRVAALRSDGFTLPPGMTVDHRALTQAKRNSGEWRRQFAAAGRDTAHPDAAHPDAADPNAADPNAADPHHATGAVLALAYPDRVGRSRGAGGRYLLVNGRGAHFGEPQALAKAEFIVAAELDGADREARIFLAAPIDAAQIDRLFAPQIEERADVVWEHREQAVRARRERRLGALVLESAEIRKPDTDAVQTAALTGLKALGIGALPWTPAIRQWQARVALLRRHDIPAPAPWPDVSDAALLATVETWAPPWLDGITRREHFSRFDLANALRGQLSRAQCDILDREAPLQLAVPSGSRMPIDYLDGEIPTVSVRLQEMFGLTLTPSIANGRIALLLKLLSPAGRPVQITRDLVSFWNRGYHEVKRDLKGRYPKHYWPDDPHAALPTRRARPR
jgi:ATP-dependent helicase HrpB